MYSLLLTEICRLGIKYERYKNYIWPQCVYLPDKDCYVCINKIEDEYLHNHKRVFRLSNFDDKLEVMIFLQYWQNLNWIEYSDLDDKRRADLVKDYILYLQGETFDLLNCIPYKTHREQKDNTTIKSNVIEEVVDILKYSLSFLGIFDISADELFNEFVRKTSVVEQRFLQEKKLDLNNKNVIVIDIDGVIAEYPEMFLKFIEKETGIQVDILKIESLDIQKEIEKFGIDLKLYLDLKHKYRDCGCKRNIPAVDGASKFLKILKDNGYIIILMTSRPYVSYKRLWADTLEWLRDNNMAYDKIVWDDNKNERVIKEYPELKFMVEDNPEHANKVVRLGIKVYLIDRPYNKNIELADGVIKVDNLFEILKRENLV